jgi:hypothetical protein
MEKYCFFNNEHLRRAFWLREKGKYKQALKELNLACKENDGQAFYVKAQAYASGGWRLCKSEADKLFCLGASLLAGCDWGCIQLESFLRPKNSPSDELLMARAKTSKDPLTRATWLISKIPAGKDADVCEETMAVAKCLIEAFDQGNVMAYPYYSAVNGLCFEKLGHTANYIQMGADIGEVKCMVMPRSIWLNDALSYCQIAVRQRHYDEMMDRLHVLVKTNQYYNVGETGWIEYAKLQIATKFQKHDTHCIDRIACTLSTRFDKTPLRLHELWLYGRAFQPCPSLVQRLNIELKDKCITVFMMSNDRTRKAIYAWEIVTSRLGKQTINRDIIKTITRLVWKSRKYPHLWNVIL